MDEETSCSYRQTREILDLFEALYKQLNLVNDSLERHSKERGGRKKKEEGQGRGVLEDSRKLIDRNEN